MSLSTPATSHPCSHSKRTHSEPINPPEPVTNAFISLSFQSFPCSTADSEHAETVGEDLCHLGDAINPLLVVHRQIANHQVKLARAEKELVIAPPIGDAPVSEMRLDAPPVLAPQHLGSAQRVFDALVEQVGEESSEQ